MHTAFAAPTDAAEDIHLADHAQWTALKEAGGASEGVQALLAYAEAVGFHAGRGEVSRLADASGRPGPILAGLGDGRDKLAVAALSAKLKGGTYRIASAPKDWSFAHIAAGWADGAYRFDAYLREPSEPPRLVVPDTEDAAALSREAEAAKLVRDLVNTPAGDMGPEEIEGAVRAIAEPNGADVVSIVGDDLLDLNYPMIHAVGRAAGAPPRFVELSWGEADAPELAIIGKGVAFDTGGLNIKTGDYMRLMKKDMGGAAHAIGLASLVMGAGLPVRLKLYIPTVENAVSGDAFRPGDILKSRKGLSVEIDNPDAEGRLILAVAIAKACESDPDLMIDFATLTGAARVALGADLAPFYTDDETLSADIQTGAAMAGDPVWRMPLWDPYLSDLKSPIADLVNSGGRFAGSITAALFLKQFVDARSWVHFDIWAWRLAKYGRPQGGAATALRAVWAMLQARYGR